MFRARYMVLSAHSDAGFNNESKARSQADANIFLSNNDQVPRCNRPILTISQIVCFVMSSAAKVKLGGLFVISKLMVPICQTLIEMGSPQPPTPIQTDISTSASVVNNTIVLRDIKSMDLIFHFLRYYMVQGQFRFYWAPVHLN